MAILKSSAKIIVRNSTRYVYSGPVLALGVPEIYATYQELKNWFPAFTQHQCPLTSKEVQITTNEIGRQLDWVTAKTFFKSLGVSDLFTIDIPGCEHVPDLVHDLNNPLPEHYLNRFNLVLDPGTVEHTFDLKTALTNIVRALMIGGVVIHQVPVYSYNGGYISINPNLLNDFYSSNGFGDLRTYIIMWDRYRAYTGKHRVYEYDERTLGQRHALADYDQCRYSPHMLFFGKKQTEKSSTVVPLQYGGQYVLGLSGTHGNEDRITYWKWLLRSTLALAYRILPFAVAFYFESWARRQKTLRIARKNSSMQ